MNEHDIAEVSFNNGYEKGYADGKAKVMSKIAFPRFLVRPTELTKKDVEDILMQSPTITMDKDEIIPIYHYRWIPVTERLPEEWNRVLVYIPHIDVMTFAKLRGGSWYSTWSSTKLDHVSHWMPLPEPPKGE